MNDKGAILLSLEVRQGTGSMETHLTAPVDPHCQACALAPLCQMEALTSGAALLLKALADQMEQPLVEVAASVILMVEEIGASGPGPVFILASEEGVIEPDAYPH